MTVITCMNRAIAKELSREAIEVLTKHFAAKGINVTRKNGVYSATDFKLPVIFTVEQDGSGNTVLNRDERAYNDARKFNSKMLPLGSLIMHGGERFNIIGYAPRSYKFPVLAKNSKGVVYKLPLTACEKK